MTEHPQFYEGAYSLGLLLAERLSVLTYFWELGTIDDIDNYEEEKRKRAGLLEVLPFFCSPDVMMDFIYVFG